MSSRLVVRWTAASGAASAAAPLQLFAVTTHSRVGLRANNRNCLARQTPRPPGPSRTTMTGRQNTTRKYLPPCRLRFAADARAGQRLPALLHDIGLGATKLRRSEGGVNHCAVVAADLFVPRSGLPGGSLPATSQKPQAADTQIQTFESDVFLSMSLRVSLLPTGSMAVVE